MSCYLGIDIGTHESKGVLIDADGQVLFTETTPHETDHPQPGWYSHDADRVWWGDLCLLSRRILEKAAEHGIRAEEIGCIGISALGCDCVPVDEKGRAIADAVLYGIDSRAEEEIALICERYGKEEAVRLFGHEPCSSDIAPKILWFRRHMPDVWEKAYKFLTASSYLCARLTGRFVLDPYLAEDFLPLYDISCVRAAEGAKDEASSGGSRLLGKESGVDPEHIRDFCRPDQMAELLGATEIAGYVTAEAAEETGLSEGTPVLTGTGDSGAEAVSSGLCVPGDLMIQLGSTAYMIALSDRLIDEPRLWPGTFILPGTFGICAGTNTAGALTEWLRRTLYPKDANAGFDLMQEEAAQVPPGSGGLICLPYWDGERTPLNDPDAKGMYFGLGNMHGRGHLIRAALEGICYSIRANVALMKDRGVPVRRILAVGGGTKNEVWLQCMADILEAEICVPEVSVGAAYGDALMAALAGGAFKDWRELSERIRIEKLYRPRKETFFVYRRQSEIFEELYDVNRELMHRL